MPDAPNLLYSLDRLAGVWATGVHVHRTRTDFTLDFGRADLLVPGRAVLVARVAIAPTTADNLLRELGAHWAEYERGILPAEVFDEEEEP